jgi:bacterial/archaeal transporter family-2 protein
MSSRTTERAVPLAAAILGGSLLPAQFATNGALAGQLHSATLAGAVSYLIGTALLLVVVKARGLSPNWPAARRAPRWAWLGGVVGSAYVIGSVLLTRALGALIATTLVITAQIVTAILLDHLGVLGLRQRRVNRARVAAVLLAFAALALRLWGTR